MLAALSLFACGSSQNQDGTVPTGSKGEGSQARQDCTGEPGDISKVDLDTDGNPEITHINKGGKRFCSEYDPDDNGTVDSRYFYEADGKTFAVVESDLDYDGRIDELSYYKGGKIARKEIDSNWDTKIDFWMWCEGGMVSRAERDQNSDGKADVWEEYRDGVIIKAAYDDNGDGDPERWEIFDTRKLVKVQYDLDFDSKPDREEKIPVEEQGEPDDRLACITLSEDARRPTKKQQAAPSNIFEKVETTPEKEKEEGSEDKGETDAASDGDAATDANAENGDDAES